MAQLLSDKRDIDFVLYEMFDAASISKHEKFSDFNRKTIDLMINESKNFATKEMLPLNRIGDEEGCKFENGKVTIPEAFHQLYRKYIDAGYMEQSRQGQGIPNLVSTASNGENIAISNPAFIMYPGLNGSCAGLIEKRGTEKQKKLYMTKMYSGEWGGTMCLTEPDAGSDLGRCTTSAKRNGDGTYSISGNKIFISGGEQDLTENIIHLVIARLEDAPAGSKGLSLFVVPKIWVNDDGTLGEPNDVVCTGIEEKMGLHGSATCALSFGGSGKCRGTLMGEENRGLANMFHLMNHARLGVGSSSMGYGTAAYQYAVNYARERIQGTDILQSMDPNAPAVPIIRHPDVRRMLLWMKAHVEGMRGFTYYVASLFDGIEISENQNEKDRLLGIIELLTPVLKAYNSETAYEVCVQAFQVYGGAGFIHEYPIDQLLRDAKIASVYEGSNGIQAMDLLGRKLFMNKGKPLADFIAEIRKTIALAEKVESLTGLANKVENVTKKLEELGAYLTKTFMSEKMISVFSYAHPFLKVVGDVIVAWIHLWRALAASNALKGDNGKKADMDFYNGQIITAEYYIEFILPPTYGKINAIMAGNESVTKIPETAFRP
jgi:hypothetical protein